MCSPLATSCPIIPAAWQAINGRFFPSFSFSCSIETKTFINIITLVRIAKPSHSWLGKPEQGPKLLLEVKESIPDKDWRTWTKNNKTTINWSMKKCGGNTTRLQECNKKLTDGVYLWILLHLSLHLRITRHKCKDTNKTPDTKRAVIIPDCTPDSNVESDTVFVTKMKQAETEIKLTHNLFCLCGSLNLQMEEVWMWRNCREKRKRRGCAYKCGYAWKAELLPCKNNCKVWTKWGPHHPLHHSINCTLPEKKTTTNREVMDLSRDSSIP